ncbi:Il18 [Columba guinea]|nr:Il18 [Columba guinea]
MHPYIETARLQASQAARKSPSLARSNSRPVPLAGRHAGGTALSLPRASPSTQPHGTPQPHGFRLRRPRVKMSDEDILVRAVQLGENFCLYFEGLECDAFCKEKVLHRVLRNVRSQLLVVRPDLDMAAFEDVTDQEMKSGSGMHFNVHYYKTTTPSAGMPVAFSIQEGEVPKEIPDESNVIFFKKTFTSFSSRTFKFEYSLEQGMFLAFEDEGYLRKLILKKLSREDEVDETMEISLQVNSE